MKLDAKQERVVKATDNKILCLATAGAGKSSVIVEKIRYLITRKRVNPEDIVAITFTNQAAQEMVERLDGIADNMFIGTIHSYANKICSANGIDNTENILQQNFDKIIEKALLLPQEKYIHIRYLFVDECQDISKLEYNFLMEIPTDNIFLVGDERQQIYSFRGTSDVYLREMYLNDGYTKYFLVNNYRSAPNIIKFAEDFIKNSENLSPAAVPIKTKNGAIEECPFNNAVDELEWSGDWGNWAILTRTNNELERAQEILNEREIPNITFKKGDLDNTILKSLMATNRVKVLTVHASKGLSFPNVIAVGERTYNEEERRIAYVAATRAERVLYWCPTIAKRSMGKKDLSFKQKNNIFNKSAIGVIEF